MTSLRWSMKRRCGPSADSMAKASTTGVCGTSLPRMLKAQATDDGIGEHGVRDAVLGEPGGKPRQLVPGELAGIGDRVDLDLGERRRRPVGPQLVDRIAVDRHQCRADLFGGRAQRLGVGDGVQPGIEADARALAEILADPGGRRRLDQALDA